MAWNIYPETGHEIRSLIHYWITVRSAIIRDQHFWTTSHRCDESTAILVSNGMGRSLGVTQAIAKHYPGYRYHMIAGQFRVSSLRPAEE